MTAAYAVKAGLPMRHIEALPLLHACDAPVLTLLQGEAYRAHRDRIEAGVFDPALAARLAKGATIGDDALAAARRELAAIGANMLDAVLPPNAILILPVMPCETPPVRACDPNAPEFSPRGLYALSAFTRFANGLGLPVITISAGSTARACRLACNSWPGVDAIPTLFHSPLISRLHCP